MRIPLAIALVALCGTPLSADLKIVEKSVARSGDRVIESVRSTYIKGTRMRIDVTQDGATTVTVYDLPAGEMLELDAAKRKVVARKVVARNAKLEKEYPRARSTMTVTPTGARKNIAGVACDEHRFDGRVPVSSKSDAIVLTFGGTACLATDPGVTDYSAFAKAAYEQNLVLGRATDNFILLAMIRGQTELYRALSRQGGAPLTVDLLTEVDGKGILAGLVRKPLAGTRVTAAARVEAATLDDALFAVPAGWKRESK